MEVNLRHTRVNHFDAARVQAEQANGVLPGVLRNRDQPRGSPENVLRQAFVRAEIGRGVQFRHKASGHVIQRRRELDVSRRISNLVRHVEHVGLWHRPLQHRQHRRDVGQIDASQVKMRPGRAENRPLMIQADSSRPGAGSVKIRSLPACSRKL